MSISSLSTHSSKLSRGDDTSLVIKQVLGEHDDVIQEPLEHRDFRDTLARLSAQHEPREEDNPESDTAYQALLEPIKVEQELTIPPLHDFLPIARSFTMPDRPKTSPSKLALSVELTPVTDQDDLLSRARQRARLELLAPLDHELTPPTLQLTSLTSDASSQPRAHIEPLARFTERNADPVTEAEPTPPPISQENDDIELDLTRRDTSIEGQPFSREQAPLASPMLKTPPVPVAPSAADIAPQPALPETQPGAAQAARAEQTGGSLLHDAVERTQLSRRVTLSMENSPIGQKLELDIKDIFGKPLTLKIVFEDQRARATCFGSQFHDPDQLEHVLDSVRTALEASGFELGDFIMHHHKDRRPAPEQQHAQGAEPIDEEQPEAPRREILRIVGIVNRIA